jgi:hypothetical protein
MPAGDGGGVGGSGNSGGTGQGGTGTGGAGLGGASGGSCWLPVQFPIEVKTAGSAVVDYTATEPDLTPFMCLSAAVWPAGTSPWDDPSVTKPEKFFLTSAVPTPPGIFNLDLAANLAPTREDGFAAGTWNWEVFVTGGPECVAVGNEHPWSTFFETNPGESGWYSLEKLAGGTFTIECGQLPFKVTGQLLWRCSAYAITCTPESNGGGSGGTGGSGGGSACTPIPGDTACLTCAKGKCCPQLSALYAHPDYAAYMSCVNACSTDDCKNACLSQYPALTTMSLAVASCAAQNCSAECAA